MEKQNKDLQSACEAIKKLANGNIRDRLIETLLDIAEESIQTGSIPPSDIGVSKMLTLSMSFITTKEDIFFLAIHFLALQKGWVPINNNEKKTSSTNNANANGIEALLPPNWSNDTPRNGSSAVSYLNKQQQTVTLSSLLVDEQIIVHLHMEDGTETSETLNTELKMKDMVPKYETWINDLNLNHINSLRTNIERSFFSNGSTKKRRSTKNKNTLLTQKSKPNTNDGKNGKNGNDGNGTGQRLMMPNQGRGNGMRPGSFGFDQDLHPSFGGGGAGGIGGMGGGSLIGPNHPGFGFGRGNNPPGVPPAARFDPFGPGVDGRGGGRGGGRGSGRGGGRGGGMGFGAPGPDHLPPPGLGNERPDWMYQ